MTKSSLVVDGLSVCSVESSSSTAIDEVLKSGVQDAESGHLDERRWRGQSVTVGLAARAAGAHHGSLLSAALFPTHRHRQRARQDAPSRTPRHDGVSWPMVACGGGSLVEHIFVAWTGSVAP